MDKLTERQQEIFDFIKEYMREAHMPPTRVEIAEAFGFRSPNASEDHLKALERKGVIYLIPGSSRGIQLMEDEPEGLPLIGRVAAGSPILAQEHVENHFSVSGAMFNPPADYLLKVHGLSMRDAGIFEGDLLAVHRTQKVKNGQVVVARLHDEVTVKRFEKKGKQVFLHPENPDFSVIKVDLKNDHLEIEGIAVGVIRNGVSL